jgi:ATP-dependent DNA helicase PIF1
MFLTLKRQTFQYKYTYEAYYYKASSSIILTYAIISHKAQGATVKSKVLIDIKNSFVAYLVYLMLSRVINRSNLLIQGTLEPSYSKCVY